MDAVRTPFITVIVPVRNEARCIERTLTRLVEQQYPADRFEIIVADGRSTDDTVAIVECMGNRFGHIRVLDNPGRLSSAARNLGVQHGRGDLFIVVDGHCDIADPLYLQNLADEFERTGADCLGRPQPLEIDSPSALQQAIALARRSWLGHNPGSFIYSSQPQFVKASSVAVAYRREVFQRVGLFDEQFDACEDVEFNTRVDAAGMKCWFSPAIAVHYHPRSSVRGLFFQMARYGRGRLRLAHKHPHALTLPALAPMAFVAGLTLCLVLTLWQPLFAVLFAGVLAAYSIVVLATTVALLPRVDKWSTATWLPVVFAAVHFGFAWGSARELVRNVFGAVRRRCEGILRALRFHPAGGS